MVLFDKPPIDLSKEQEIVAKAFKWDSWKHLYSKLRPLDGDKPYYELAMLMWIETNYIKRPEIQNPNDQNKPHRIVRFMHQADGSRLKDTTAILPIKNLAIIMCEYLKKTDEDPNTDYATEEITETDEYYIELKNTFSKTEHLEYGSNEKI